MPLPPYRRRLSATLGATGDFTYGMGGGAAVEGVYFLDGKDAGKSETFKTTRQSVGLNIGYGVYGISGDYFNKKK